MRKVALGVLVALAAALPFLVAGTGPFVELDDWEYVVDNPMVRAGLSLPGARWALTTLYAGNWHPLTWLSHQLDATLFGAAARGPHLVNVALHALGAVLLFAALARLTGAAGRSAFVAGVFAAHPLHVESVAWVSERKDVLAGALFGLVLLAWARYVRRRGTGAYLAALALFALALAAKPTVVTLPALLLLLDVWPLGRARPPAPGRALPAFPAPLLLEKAPFLLLALGAGAVTLVAQRSGGSLAGLDAVPLPPRLANALASLAAYAGQALLPTGLAPFYPLPRGPLPWWQPAAGALLLLGATAAALRGLRRRPWLACGWLWFAGMLLPMIGIVQVGTQARADRYTYLPLTGLAILAAWGLPGLLAGRRAARAALGAAGVAVVAACAALSTAQAALWTDSERLFTHTLAVAGESWAVEAALGSHLAAEGRLPEAIARQREALRLRPREVETIVALGGSLARSGQLPEAVGLFRRALELDPADAMAHYDLALALSQLGGVRRSEVIAHYREALRLRPASPEAHNNLAAELDELGRRDEAIAHWREALRLSPGYADARENLARALAAGGGAAAPVTPR